MKHLVLIIQFISICVNKQYVKDTIIGTFTIIQKGINRIFYYLGAKTDILPSMRPVLNGQTITSITKKLIYFQTPKSVEKRFLVNVIEAEDTDDDSRTSFVDVDDMVNSCACIDGSRTVYRVSPNCSFPQVSK